MTYRDEKTTDSLKNRKLESSTLPTATWGGRRLGAGRKPLVGESKTKYVSIRLTDAEAEKLKKLGGSKWIRDQLSRV